MATNRSERATRLRPATAADLLALAEHRLYMGANWLLTFQVWAMELMYQAWGGTLAYLQTIPDVEANVIYVRGARKEDEGALEITFSDTRRTGTVNLHYAAARFHKRPKEGRRLSIPVQMVEDPDLGRVLKLDIGAAAVVPAQKRGEEEDAAAKPDAAKTPAASTTPAAAPAAVAPASTAAPASAAVAPVAPAPSAQAAGTKEIGAI